MRFYILTMNNQLSLKVLEAVGRASKTSRCTTTTPVIGTPPSVGGHLTLPSVLMISIQSSTIYR